jgi:pimeloyl-ACP methyl ester carboxylesterase
MTSRRLPAVEVGRAEEAPVAIAVRSTSVRGLTMSCREAGTGSPIILLHGNPTSSYLW